MSAPVLPGDRVPMFRPDLGHVADEALALAVRLDRGELAYSAAEDRLAAQLAGPGPQDVEAVRTRAAGWLCRAVTAREVEE